MNILHVSLERGRARLPSHSQSNWLPQDSHSQSSGFFCTPPGCSRALAWRKTLFYFLTHGAAGLTWRHNLEVLVSCHWEGWQKRTLYSHPGSLSAGLRVGVMMREQARKARRQKRSWGLSMWEGGLSSARDTSGSQEWVQKLSSCSSRVPFFQFMKTMQMSITCFLWSNRKVIPAWPQLLLHWSSWPNAQCTRTPISRGLQPRMTAEHKPPHLSVGITVRAGSPEFNSGHN